MKYFFYTYIQTAKSYIKSILCSTEQNLAAIIKVGQVKRAVNWRKYIGHLTQLKLMWGHLLFRMFVGSRFAIRSYKESTETGFILFIFLYTASRIWLRCRNARNSVE